MELVLSCGSWQEAQRIADALLGQGLITVAEFMQVQADGVKLIMGSMAEKLEKIEQEIARLHSDPAFALQAIPVQFGKL